MYYEQEQYYIVHDIFSYIVVKTVGDVRVVVCGNECVLKACFLRSEW